MSIVECGYQRDFEKKLIVPIFQLLYQILGHVYEYHYDTICELEEEPHLNGLLAHFITFGREFSLFPTIDASVLGALTDRLFPPSASGSPGAPEMCVRRVSESEAS